ncbi:MAG: NlpC/P60 family protein, partial [Ornithinimicrobium sp.]
PVGVWREFTMSVTARARHRAPRRLSLKPAAKVFVTLAATSGLALSTAGSSQAAPATPKTPTTKGLATTPAALPAVAPAATPAPSRVLPTPRGYTTYRWGSRGGSVKTIQRIVGAYPDGVFGPKTHSRVKSWQRRNGLVADGIVGPITSRAMGLSTSSRSSSSASRSSSRSSSSVITNAKRNLGVRYSWAGNSPRTGFDCSGFVNYVFKQSGISLPRTASGIQRATTRTSSPRPGDLVFHGYPATHVGIYAGGGKFYDSGRSTNGTTLRSIFPGSVNYGRVN